MKRHLTLILLIVMPFIKTVAQDYELEEEEIDTTVIMPRLIDSIVGYMPENLDMDIQKLLDGWHARHFTDPDDFCEDSDVNPYFPDSAYIIKMKRMPTVIPMTYNDAVRKFINQYTVRMRKSLRYWMGLADFYFPMIEQKLDAHGLPLELKYLAVVESALNPVAQSRVGASGIWQFMLPTGKAHGLEINSLIDERLDPDRATDAACKYFKDMYDQYGDWYLSIAAYNCGPGAVNRAITRAGGKMDFWKIYQHLPPQTRSYVPCFIAIAYAMTYHCDHNICPIQSTLSVATDTIMVERALHFDQIAEILQMDKEAIRFYNSQYKREIIPGNVKPSVLRLPIDKTFAFVNYEDSIYTHRMEELLANCTPIDVGQPENRKERITHTVKAGETVYTIANLYGVTAKNLRDWNGLRTSRVQAGRSLKVNIDNGGLRHTAQNVKTASPQNATAQKTENGLNYISYKVQSGDTLSAIAKRHPGLTVKKIQDANGLNTTNLRIGQILMLPQG